MLSLEARNPKLSHWAESKPYFSKWSRGELVLCFLQPLVALAFLGLWPHHSSFCLRGHTVSSSSVSVPVALFFPLVRIHVLMGRVTWIIRDNLFISRHSGTLQRLPPAMSFLPYKVLFTGSRD